MKSNNRLRLRPFRAILWTPLRMISRKLEKQPSCLPFGKAEDTASSLLPGRRTLLWQAGQEFGVADYSLTLAALNLRHPRLLQRQGLRLSIGAARNCESLTEDGISCRNLCVT